MDKGFTAARRYEFSNPSKYTMRISASPDDEPTLSVEVHGPMNLAEAKNLAKEIMRFVMYAEHIEYDTGERQ